MKKKPEIWKKDQVVELRDRFISQHKHEHTIELECMAHSIQTDKMKHTYDAATMYARATGIMSICYTRLIAHRRLILNLTDDVSNSDAITSISDSISREREIYDNALRKMQLVLSANKEFFDELK